MKLGIIALFAALVMMAVPAWAGPFTCGPNGDDDSDTVCNDFDNCSQEANLDVSGAGGCDTDSDGYGGICDGDLNNDGLVSVADFTIVWLTQFGLGSDGGTGSDMNCDTLVSVSDFTIQWLAQFALPGSPGPSGLSCAGTPPCAGSN
jgi:hypothetical protein